MHRDGEAGYNEGGERRFPPAAAWFQSPSNKWPRNWPEAEGSADEQQCRKRRDPTRRAPADAQPYDSFCCLLQAENHGKGRQKLLGGESRRLMEIDKVAAPVTVRTAAAVKLAVAEKHIVYPLRFMTRLCFAGRLTTAAATDHDGLISSGRLQRMVWRPFLNAATGWTISATACSGVSALRMTTSAGLPISKP